MTIADSLDSWFETRLNTMPNILFGAQSSASSINMLLENLPVGITEYNVLYRNIPFKRSGCTGWTYFPVTDDGKRLARVSYRSPLPNVYIRAMVRLIDYETKDDDTVTCAVDERALLIFDNLTPHGAVLMRSENQANKRQKLHVTH